MGLDKRDKRQKILKIKIAVRLCPKCDKSKSLDQYNVDLRRTDGVRLWCKSCVNIVRQASRNTRVGFLKKLLSDARYNTKERNKKGRDHKFTLTMPKLNKLITDQDGKCAISGAVLVFKSFSDNQASVDRIKDNLGYVDGNCRLVCLEFNTRTKWSRNLLLKSIALSGIPPQNFQLETSDLETVLSKAHAKGTVLRKWTVLTEDGIETVFCHHCSETKPRSDFNKQISQGCKTCCVQIVQQTRTNWRGALHQLIGSARSDTEKRNAHRSKDAQTECELTYMELVAILKAQGGMRLRGAYSQVALSPRAGDWKVSLERKDVRLGYREYAVPATSVWFANGSTG